ncbi:TetR/AcrR family transcriptional regulator [Virgibacillus sp. W0430]|uniref:TetR/AcrR family transcriptional regulator n=1 Tax=Virgibacillus sp. W0430 TaxID=3391580 RepID=UPI003F4602CF
MKKNSRDNMIESTAFLLQKRGYVGTGVNDIIEHSGSPKGSLYYHFPEGKEQLALEAVKWTNRNVTAFIKGNLEKYTDPVVSIKQFILDSANRFEKDNYFHGVPITALVLETASISDNLRMACQEVFDAWSTEFANKLVEQGYNQKEAENLGTTINIMIQGAFVISLAKKNAEALKVVAEKIPLLLGK